MWGSLLRAAGVERCSLNHHLPTGSAFFERGPECSGRNGSMDDTCQIHAAS